MSRISQILEIFALYETIPVPKDDLMKAVTMRGNAICVSFKLGFWFCINIPLHFGAYCGDEASVCVWISKEFRAQQELATLLAKWCTYYYSQKFLFQQFFTSNETIRKLQSGNGNVEPSFLRLQKVNLTFHPPLIFQLINFVIKGNPDVCWCETTLSRLCAMFVSAWRVTVTLCLLSLFHSVLDHWSTCR